MIVFMPQAPASANATPVITVVSPVQNALQNKIFQIVAVATPAVGGSQKITELCLDVTPAISDEPIGLDDGASRVATADDSASMESNWGGNLDRNGCFSSGSHPNGIRKVWLTLDTERWRNGTYDISMNVKDADGRVSGTAHFVFQHYLQTPNPGPLTITQKGDALNFSFPLVRNETYSKFNSYDVFVDDELLTSVGYDNMCDQDNNCTGKEEVTIARSGIARGAHKFAVEIKFWNGDLIRRETQFAPKWSSAISWITKLSRDWEMGKPIPLVGKIDTDAKNVEFRSLYAGKTKWSAWKKIAVKKKKFSFTHTATSDFDFQLRVPATKNSSKTTKSYSIAVLHKVSIVGPARGIIDRTLKFNIVTSKGFSGICTVSGTHEAYNLLGYFVRYENFEKILKVGTRTPTFTFKSHFYGKFTITAACSNDFSREVIATKRGQIEYA